MIGIINQIGIQKEPWNTMKKILHINAHHPYSFSEGKLNAALTEHAITIATEKGYEARQTLSAENYNVDEEVEKHQ